VQNDVTIRLNRSNEGNINGPTTNVRWSPNKTRTSCLMIVVESSNVLIWPLHAPICNFSVIRIINIWMQQQFQVFWNTRVWYLKKPGFRVVENSRKIQVSHSGKTRVGNINCTYNFFRCPQIRIFCNVCDTNKLLCLSLCWISYLQAQHKIWFLREVFFSTCIVQLHQKTPRSTCSKNLH